MSNTAALSLPTPVIDVIGGESNTIISGSASLIFPYITNCQISGVTGFYGSVALTLPTPSIKVASGIGAIALTLPVSQLAITGEQGNLGAVALTLPTPVALATAVTGTTGSVALALPSFKLCITSSSRVTLALPIPTLQSSGFFGSIGSVSMTLRAPVINASGSTPNVGQVALQLVPKLQVAGTVGIAGNVAMTLRQIALATHGYSGFVGGAQLALPVMQMSATGVELAVGTVALSLPLLVLQSNGFVQPGASFSTIVMHTESMALSTYDNYNFNSFAKFNGVYLGANGSGIFALSGATDDGALINAAARVGITDFGTSHLKRVDRMYVGYRTDGDMVLRVFTDETTSRDYLLTSTGKTGMHGNHVRIGKGLAARYWQFEIQNRFGSDFEMNMIEVKPTVLRRRIGGGDA